MKNIYAVNCSPRKNGNTAAVLESALKGAADAGAGATMINLCELNFSGCRSCFACKRKNCAAPGKCAVRDELTPVLEKICDGDGLLVGTPVYFGGETGLCRNFIERLFFPVLSYDDFSVSLASRKFPAAFIYTMNVTYEQMLEFGYPEKLRPLSEYAARMFGGGSPKTLFVCDTYQFSDYSRYRAGVFDVRSKEEARRTKFPEDCGKAYRMGRSMAE